MTWYSNEQSDSEYNISLENWRTRHKDTIDSMNKEITKINRERKNKEKRRNLFSKILNFFWWRD